MYDLIRTFTTFFSIFGFGVCLFILSIEIPKIWYEYSFVTIAGIAFIMLAVLSGLLLGDGLRDAFDPKNVGVKE